MLNISPADADLQIRWSSLGAAFWNQFKWAISEVETREWNAALSFSWWKIYTFGSQHNQFENKTYSFQNHQKLEGQRKEKTTELHLLL